tara:strand:+ start:357 stop:743 length:387 start_codon:yes stop_codon:yes gene_type:complete
MKYNKTWEVMNDLEESFNRIVALEKMIDDLNDAVNHGDKNAIVDLTAAMTAYMPVYIRQYEKASQRAWNNTVVEVAKVDNPYKTSTGSSVTYGDVVKYLETDTLGNYVSEPQDKTIKDSGTGINEEGS